MSELVRRLIVPLAAMIIAFGAGWSVGSGGQRPTWQPAEVKVAGTTATVTVNGTSYSVTGAVPAWIDADGNRHASDWPTCFTTLDGSSARLKVVVSTLSIDKQSIDAVMAVDCRPVS
jgi:hypothetical protein